MPIAVVCPKCSARLNAPDGAAGKNVKCPKCQAPIVVPTPGAGAEFEVVEEEPPVKRPAARPAVRAAAEVDEEDEKPRRKRPQAADDEDDDGDERPRKKKKRKQSAGNPAMVRNIVGGIVLLALLGVAAWVFYDPSKDKEDTAASSKGGDETRGVVPKVVMPGGGAGLPLNPGGNAGGNPGGVVGGNPGGGAGGNPAGGGQPAPNPTLKTAQISAPMLSADGNYVLGRSGFVTQGSVGVWDARTGNFVVGVGGKSGADQFGISPDGKQVAVLAFGPQTLTFWDVPSGQLQKTLNLGGEEGGGGPPPFITYAPDGKSVVTAYGGKLVRIDPQTGLVVALGPDVRPGGDVAYAAGKNVAAVTSGPGGDIRMFDLAAGGEPRVLPKPETGLLVPSTLAVSADGSVIAAGVTGDARTNAPPAVVLYDAATGQLKGRLPLETGNAHTTILQVHLSPNGGRVLVKAQVVSGGRPEFFLRLSDPTGKALVPVAGDARVSQVTGFAADGKTFAYTLANAVQFYDADKGKASDLRP